MANDEPAVLLRSSEFTEIYERLPAFRILDEDLFDQELLSTLGIEYGSLRHDTLLGWQRLLRIHPEESVAEVFHEDGLRSANAIARIPRGQFAARYAGRLPGPVPGDLAGQIHDRAAAAAAKCAHAFADVIGMLSPQVRGTPFGNAAPGLSAELGRVPGFDDLFGPQNFLGCQHCGSIFGPAAYFTDLMRIIDRYITDPASGNQIPPGRRLEDRRPDLFYSLKLDCAATSDEVTYLTLVNEILAAQICPDQAAAQQALATARYPFSTPFNFPLSKIRQALGQLGTSLAEIWATCQAPVHAGVAQGYQFPVLMLDQGASRRDGAYTLMEVVMADGPAAGQRRRIIDYRGQDWIATLDRPFDPPPSIPSSFLIFDPLAAERDTLNLTAEMAELLLAPPADVAALSTAYGVDDIMQYVPHGGEGTLTVRARTTSAELAGGTFTPADVGAQLLIGGQLRTVVALRDPSVAVMETAWESDASGSYAVMPALGLDRAENFAERTGLTMAQLGTLLRQGLSDAELAAGVAGQFYINDSGDAPGPLTLVLDQTDPGNSVERIVDIRLDRLDRLNRFIRLAAVTGIAFEDLDWAMRLSGAQTGISITAGTIASLALLVTAVAKTGMSVRAAAAYLGDLKTIGRGDGPVPADPFDQIYNSPALLGGRDPYAPDSMTPFDPARPRLWNYLAYDVDAQTLRTRLGAALGLGDADLTALASYCAGLAGVEPPGILTLDLGLLSRFNRIVTAAGIARWPVRGLLRLIEAMGAPPPGDLAGLLRLLDVTSWIDAGPLSLDDVAAVAVPADITAVQRDEIRAFLDIASAAAADTAVTAESFLSPEIDAESSAELVIQLTGTGVINDAGIMGIQGIDYYQGAFRFPVSPDAFVSELIDQAASAAIVRLLLAWEYLIRSLGLVVLSHTYNPDVSLEFLFPPETPLRAEMIMSVRGVLAQIDASISRVVTVLFTARDTQEALAADATARFLALDPGRFGAALRLVTGSGSLTGYRQGLLTPVPAGAPLPDALVQLIGSLWRARRWITALAFTPAELAALAAAPAAFNVADPAAPSVGDLRSLASFRTLATRFGTAGGGLTGYLTGTATGTETAAALAAITGWPSDQVAAALSALWPLGDVAVQPPVRSVAAVAALAACFGLAARVSADVQSLLGLAVLRGGNADAQAAGYWPTLEAVAGTVLGMLAAHTGEGFGTAFSTFSGAVDTAYRDVLLGYVVWRLASDGQPVAGPGELNARLLIDTRMSACDVTTPIAQAITSAQLYLQRCRLGLEDGVADLSGIAPQWWEWMSAYRVWEANRKVFLYPENYLDPTLRRGGSPEFDALRQSLTQTRVSEATVTAAYGEYFQRLAGLAALVPCAAYQDVVPGADAASASSTLYLLARTRTAPYSYYYLTRGDDDRWAPWRKIDLTINSAFVTPVVAFGKLFLFWSQTDVVKSSSVTVPDDGTTPQTETQTINLATLRYSFQTLTGDWASPQTLADRIPVRVLPQPYQVISGNPRLAALFDPADLFWMQPQAVKIGRGLPGRARASLINLGAADPVPGLGSLSVAAGSAVVTGAGTEFLSQLRPGYRLTVAGEERQVVAVTGPAALTVDTPFETAAQASAYTITMSAGKVIGESGPWNTTTRFTAQVAVGDLVFCDAQLGMVAAVDSDTELTMARPWPYPGTGAQNYKIIPSDPLQDRFPAFTGPGSITFTISTQNVTGTGTSFLSTVSLGDQIFAAGQTRTVIGLSSDTALLVDRAWSAGATDTAYTVVPPQSGAESLFVQLGPPFDVSNPVSFPSWVPLPNGGDDPYLSALNRLNSRVSTALNYCNLVWPAAPGGQVGGGAGFLLGADLAVREVQFLVAPDSVRTPGAKRPYAATLDRDNSTMIAVSVPGSIGAYWLNASAGQPAPVPPGIGERMDALYHVSPSAGLRNVGNVSGLAVFDDGDEAFLFASQERDTWPVSERITVVPYPLAPQEEAVVRIDTGPYAPNPSGVRGAWFAVTRLTTTTIAALERKLLAGGVAGLLSPQSQRTPEQPFSRFYQTPAAGPPSLLDPSHLPPDRLSFTGSFGQYQQEIFFQTPYLAASLLTTNGRYEEARTWYHYIFDPTAEPSPAEGTGPERFWRYLPFRGITFPTLVQVLTDPAGIRAYNDDPLDPFAIAGLRTSAYAKAVVMRYVENIIAWGDALFAQDTRESVSQAANLYQMAAEVLGPRPRRVGDLPPPAPKTFGQIREEYRSRQENIPQFLIGLENSALGRTGPGDQRYAANPVNDIDAYFCVPANDVLQEYWALIEDRLGKIRSCQTLQGAARTLAPFAPPLDLKAALAGPGAAQGGHPAEIGADIPVYRFATLIDQAMRLAAQVVQFGGELLAALERKDAEDLLLLQTRQQAALLDLTTAIRRNQVDQLTAIQESLAEGLAQARYRQTSYADMVTAGLIPAEVENLRASEVALVFNALALTAQAASSVAFALPNIGSPFAMTYGGIQVGNSLQAASSVYQIGSLVSEFAADRAMLMAGYERRSADWRFQANLAGYDVRQLEAQLAASQLAIDGAIAEYALHVRTMEQTAQIEQFLRDKFTSSELYGWMTRQLSGLYFQLYTLACTTARQAERAYQLEVGSSRRFITALSWDDARRGLLAGEGLSLALGQLQQAYQQENVRTYEIERTVSLLAQDPRALLQLRSTGECLFDFAERLFDQDYPGHYRRILLSVAVTIPALVGPYQNVRGTLSQLGSQIVLKPSRAAVAYLLGDDSVPPPGPEVLRSNVRPAQSIAISTGVDDDGVFDADQADGRYLPFERTGAVSQWRLSLPFASNQIDFEAISDVVFTLRYTAFDGGTRFRGEVQQLLPGYQGRQFVSLAQQYAAGWYGFLTEPVIEDGVQLLRFQLPRVLLPPHVDPAAARATAVYLALRTPVEFQASDPFVAIAFAPATPFVPVTFNGSYAGTVAFPGGSGPLLRDLVTEPQALGFVLARAPAAFLAEDGTRLRAEAVGDVQLVIGFQGPVVWPPAPAASRAR